MAPIQSGDPISRLLNADESAQRTNRANTGKAFEREMELTAGAYESRRIASIRKVDPPTRVIWPFDPKQGRKVQRVIFMTNPWLDFAGVWTARHGRALFIEAKSTSAHRLPFLRHGGLTAEQVGTIKRWRMAGAATALLWHFDERVTLWTPEMLVAAESAGAKSLQFEHGLPVPQGVGNLRWDFLPVLEAAIWAPEKIGVAPANNC